MFKSYGIIGLLLAFHNLSYADWQYTRWGMATAQVQEAMNKVGAAKLPPFQPVEKQEGSGPVFEYMTQYSAANVDFSAMFGFDRTAGALAEVRLVPTDKFSCQTIKDSLLDRYGAVESESIDTPNRGVKWTTLRWRDVAGKNLVEMEDYIVLGKRGCSVSYKPLSSNRTRGL